MPQGVCEKPQRRTAFAFSSDERLSGPLPRTTPRWYARRTTLTPQYIASSCACVSPSVAVAPAHVEATACNAEASELCCDTLAAGAAKPRTIAVRDWAIPITRSWNRCPFETNPARSFRDSYIQVRIPDEYASKVGISSNASGFSNDERSPGSFPSTRARTARRTIFALRVFGSAETNTIRSGLNALPSSSVTAREISSAHAGVPSLSGRSTQKIHATSPLTSCGTPIAAASATAWCATAADSSSAGPMRLPAMLSVSSERPCRNQYPSSSTDAQSPCVHTPGKRRQYASR